ncbi:hypothetical protein CP061683_1398B, partial [Chlamydia psittaci 06-1683]
ITSNITIHF